MTRQPRDPAAQHEAAATLGRMEADGLLPPGEAAQTLRVIVQTAQRNAPDVDAKGLRARLVWSARDARADRQRQRDNVHTAVRWAVRGMFAAKASAADIEATAHKANGNILTRDELVVILREEMKRAQKTRRG